MTVPLPEPEMRHPERLAKVTALVTEIVDLLDVPADASVQIARLNELTDRDDLTEEDLVELYAAEDDEDFAARILMPTNIPTGLDRAQLVHVAQRIIEEVAEDQAKLHYWLKVWHRNEPSGKSSDLFFWKQDWAERVGEPLNTFEPTAEEIVEEAFRIAAESKGGS